MNISKNITYGKLQVQSEIRKQDQNTKYKQMTVAANYRFFPSCSNRLIIIVEWKSINFVVEDHISVH